MNLYFNISSLTENHWWEILVYDFTFYNVSHMIILKEYMIQDYITRVTLIEIGIVLVVLSDIL